MIVLNCIFSCTVMIIMLMMSSTFSTMVVLIPLEFVNESMSLSVTSQLKVSTRRYQDICPHSRWRWPRAAWSSETVVRRSATGWRHLPITIVACWSVTHWSSWSLVSSLPPTGIAWVSTSVRALVCRHASLRGVRFSPAYDTSGVTSIIIIIIIIFIFLCPRQ